MIALEPRTAAETATELYLELLKRSLLSLLDEDESYPQPSVEDDGRPEGPLSKLAAAGLFLVGRTPALQGAGRRLGGRPPRSLKAVSSFDREKRLDGRGFPSRALTMIGMRRLDNVQALVEDVLARNVPGDLIESGVWRGGSTIFMRGLLAVHGVADRVVWVADSFEGPPRPGQEGMERSFDSPEQGRAWKAAIGRHPRAIMAMAANLRRGTSYDDVRESFARYGLLDEQVRFLRGWFHETLPSAPIERLALLRLDGDLYDSTYQALEALYPKLSVGGYAIVDDYGSFSECRRAVDDYLRGAGGDVEPRCITDRALFGGRDA